MSLTADLHLIACTITEIHVAILKTKLNYLKFE
jgi:hypothetical protein